MASEQFTTHDGKPWTPPTTEELLARGAAAVKREYLRPLVPLIAPTAAAADEANPAAAAAGDNGTTPGVRGSEHGTDKNRTVRGEKGEVVMVFAVTARWLLVNGVL